MTPLEREQYAVDTTWKHLDTLLVKQGTVLSAEERTRLYAHSAVREDGVLVIIKLASKDDICSQIPVLTNFVGDPAIVRA